MYSFQKIMNVKELMDLALQGIGGMAPLVLLMILAFALADTCDALGTGSYVANATKNWLNPGLVPAILFLVAGFTAFSIGTSWTTFALMIPIGIPMVNLMGADLHVTLGAVLSGKGDIRRQIRY